VLTVGGRSSRGHSCGHSRGGSREKRAGEGCAKTEGGGCAYSREYIYMALPRCADGVIDARPMPFQKVFFNTNRRCVGRRVFFKDGKDFKRWSIKGPGLARHGRYLVERGLLWQEDKGEAMRNRTVIGGLDPSQHTRPPPLI
jgi:hypothetical protein